jgi:hypothetical protein
VAAGEQVATAQVNDTCGNVIQITQLDPYGRSGTQVGRPKSLQIKTGQLTGLEGAVLRVTRL